MNLFVVSYYKLNSILRRHYGFLPLTNRVRGPNCKLRTEFFPFCIMCAGHKSKGEKRGSVTYTTDRENEVSKIFIISLRLIRRAAKETS